MSVENIVLDIMGTVVPDAFKSVLMQDFADNGAKYLIDHPDYDGVGLFEQLCVDGQKPSNPSQLVVGVINQVNARNFRPEYMDFLDAVNTQGYQQGRLQADFYADVLPAFERWEQKGTGIYIFSNGGEGSQEEMFRTAKQGNLADYISEYVSTSTVGDKTTPASFLNLVKLVGIDVDKVMFLSDRDDELDSAVKAGVARAIRVKRPNHPPQFGLHSEVQTFNELKAYHL